MLRFAARIWVLPAILPVGVIAYFLDRFRGFFGHTVLTKPRAGLVNDPAAVNPEVVTFGAANTALPWRLTLPSTAPAACPNIIAESDGDTVTRRTTVNAETLCVVKSG